MEIWQSDLISVKEIENFLVSKGKKRHWLHILNYRYELMPEAIIRPRLVRSKKQPWKLFAKGRIVYYPKEMLNYLEKIIFLKRKQGLSYRQIKEHQEIIIERERLNALKKTELKADPRVKHEGFFLNFESAKRNFQKVFNWGNTSYHVIFLDKIAHECEFCCKDYYKINKQMREQIKSGDEIDKGLCQRKNEIGDKLDYCYGIMDTVIKQGVKMMNEKKISISEWFKPIKETKKK